MSVGTENSVVSQERRLSRAIEYVSRQWIPLNPKVLNAIKVGLVEGRYDLGLEFLVADLKKDLGLLSFCLRDLIRAVRQGDPSVRLESPQQLLERVPRGELQAVLDRAEKALTYHSLENLNESQSAHLRFTLVSVSAAETLAQHKASLGDTAFLSALFRQLGLLLIAWNYPTIFSKAQRNVMARDGETDDRDLEQELTAQLGFSPDTLATRVLELFSPTEEIALAVEGSDEHLDSSSENAVQAAHEIAELCRVGEALAMANDPEHYPHADEHWGAAKSTLNEVLGDEGLKRVQESFDDYSSSYRELKTDLLGETTEIAPEKMQVLRDQEKLRDLNPYAEACPLNLRQRLRQFYGWRTPDKHPQEAVKYLLKEVVPATGFEGLVVYTLDPSLSEIVPRLRFGSLTLRPIVPLQVSEGQLTQDPVLAALQIPAPCVSRVASQNRSFGAGALRGQRTIGVMYVEFSPQLAEQDNVDVLVIFKALAQALLDALGVG